MLKNIKVEDDIWDKLSRLKLDMKKKRISDVIKMLIDEHEKGVHS